MKMEKKDKQKLYIFGELIFILNCACQYSSLRGMTLDDLNIYPFKQNDIDSLSPRMLSSGICIVHILHVYSFFSVG